MEDKTKELIKMRIRWLRWLGQKTRYDKSGKPKVIITKTPIDKNSYAKSRPNGDTPLSTSPIFKFN